MMLEPLGRRAAQPFVPDDGSAGRPPTADMLHQQSMARHRLLLVQTQTGHHHSHTTRYDWSSPQRMQLTSLSQTFNDHCTLACRSESSLRQSLDQIVPASLLQATTLRFPSFFEQ